MGFPPMSFSNRIARVKARAVDVACNVLLLACGALSTSVPPHARRSKLRLYGQVRNVAEDQLLAVDRCARRWNWQGRGFSQGLRHFCDADVSREARDIQP